MFDHACAGADGGDGEVVFCGEVEDFLDGVGVWGREEEFDGIEAEACGVFESVGEGAVEDEGSGGGFGDVAEGDGGFHGIPGKRLLAGFPRHGHSDSRMMLP